MIVKVGNQRLKFPDDMSENEMEAAIQALPPETPTIRGRLKARKAVEALPPLIVDEVRKEALERQYGYIANEPFSVRTMIGNIPRNTEEIVTSIGSLLAGSAIFACRFGKNFIDDVNEFASQPESTDYSNIFPRTREQIKPATDLGKAIYTDWQALLAGRLPTETAKTPLVKGTQEYMDYLWEKVERQGLGDTIKFFIQDNPIDAMLIGNAMYRATAAGTRLTAEGIRKVVPKGHKVAKAMDQVLSTKRTPLVYEVGMTQEGTPKVVTFPRAYSKDPLTKCLFQESFDSVLDKYPGISKALTEHKAKKLINTLRNAYEDANFEERSLMHKEIFEKLDTLTKEEREIIVPYLEGRAKLLTEPSAKFKAFEGWYRDFYEGVQRDLIERGKLTPEIIQARAYQPLVRATGQTTDQVMAEFGDFKPVYVHHYFPKVYEDKTSIHFAETTGQRFKPSWLKKSKGVEGYSENLSEILPKWASEYVKFKNTEAFIKDFTDKFGIKVNIRDIDYVEGGLKVGDTLYPNHKIVAPDGYLRFYRGKVDFQREVSKRMGNMTFDEAIGEVLNETVTESVSTTKGGAELSKAGKLIEQRVKDALEARGFSIGEAEQMLSRVKAGEAPETVIKIVKEKVVTKRTGTSPEDILKLFQGVQREYVGVAKNQTVYLVPKEAVKELESFATPFAGSQKAQNVVRLIVDKPTQVWKDAVLAGSPRWLKNNIMGDIIFNTAEGVGPLSYSRAFRDIYRDVIPDELLKASFANIMKYNPKLGKTVETTFGRLVAELENTKVVRNIAKVKDKGYTVNTAGEQLFVRALYIAKARPLAKELLKAEGLPRTEVNIMNKLRLIKADPKLFGPIIDEIKTKLPVFNLTSSWERKYIKRFLPFYNWYKFMIKYAAKLPAEHPFLTVGGRGLGALSENQREKAFMLYFPFMIREIEENGIPQRFDNLWPVGEIGKEKATFFNTRGLNPFATIEDVVNLDVLPMFSPVFTIPMEQITGKAVFGDREFRSGEEGIVVNADGKVTYRDFTKVRPPLWDHILSQLPQYEMAKQLLVPAKQFDTGTIFNPDPIMDPVTGEYKYPIESIEKVLNFMGIDKKTLDIREVWEAFLKRKSIAFGRAVSKGISKDNLSFEDIREVIKTLDKKTLKQIKKELELKQKEKAEETKELLRMIREEEKK
ncbi:MAG: hypothetical protein B1H40_00035 [Candidatus Latescibacteria bacterium 4484_181]|nr:MAG: hypothetical protein B1H40_00035 [Candidatus Latescibacteria bacterium 4484_181]